jgi:mRNA degradation ribonuclease J1/J2
VSPVDEGWLVYVGDVRYDDEPAAGELGGMSTLVTPSELP